MAKDVEATWVSILSDYLKISLEEKAQPYREGGGREGEGGEGEGEKGGRREGEEGERNEEEGEEREASGLKVVEELKDNLRYLVDAWT